MKPMNFCILSTPIPSVFEYLTRPPISPVFGLRTQPRRSRKLSKRKTVAELRAQSLIKTVKDFQHSLNPYCAHALFAIVEMSELAWCGWKLRLRFSSCHEHRNAKTQFAVNMNQARDSRGSKSDTATKLTESFFILLSLHRPGRS